MMLLRSFGAARLELTSYIHYPHTAWWMGGEFDVEKFAEHVRKVFPSRKWTIVADDRQLRLVGLLGLENM